MSAVTTALWLRPNGRAKSGGMAIMRTLTALAFSVLLLTGSATTTFANEIQSVAQSTIPSAERFNDDGSGCANPTAPAVESDYERWA
jgi:hypothetical protein